MAAVKDVTDDGDDLDHHLHYDNDDDEDDDVEHFPDASTSIASRFWLKVSEMMVNVMMINYHHHHL